MKRLRRVLALATCLALGLAVPTAVWGGPLRAVDPFGKPLPSAEQSRREVERLLGQPVRVRPPVRGQGEVQPGPPYDGPDVPAAHTLAETGVLVEAVPADLAETPEVRFTPEILEVVQRFGGNPEQLYLYVKNNFEFTPYVGSQKGSQGTLLEFSGNDFDLASLLIALLRAAGIPARYVVGSMYVPIDEGLNWLGVGNPNVMLEVLQWQGVPAQIVKPGGGSLLVNRVWVEAFLVRHGPKPRWVPMDPAFKQFTYFPSSGLARAVPFDRAEYLGLPTSDRRTAYEFFRDRVLSATSPGATVEDVERSREIVPTVFSRGLPGRLENRVRVAGELSVLGDVQRYLVTLYTVDNQGVSAQVTLRLPEIYGRRLTVSFPPATTADEALVQQYGGYYQVPADLLRVRPTIKLDGQPLA